MIDELRKSTIIDDGTEWWRVKRLDFIEPRTTNNYIPIAKFIKFIKNETNSGKKVLKCSERTFFYYITSQEHSNLKTKFESLKSLVYNMIYYEYV